MEYGQSEEIQHVNERKGKYP